MSTRKRAAARKKAGGARRKVTPTKKARPRAGALPLTPMGSAPFGEAFFARVLPGMVQGCPCPTEGCEPVVRLHIVDGTTVELAQIVALADRYGVFAVFEGEGQDGVERTSDDIGLEGLPYELIARVSVRPERLRGSKLGFQLHLDGTTPRVAPLETVPAEAASAAAPAATPAATPAPTTAASSRR